MWLRMAKVTPFRVVEECLSTYRVHPDSIGSQERQANWSAVLYHLARHGPLDNFQEMYRHYVQMELERARPAPPTYEGTSLDEQAARQVADTWLALGAEGHGRPFHVALFGAGQHTRWLLDYVADLPGPHVSCILDDGAEPGQRIAGVPIIPAYMLISDSVDAVVLSSDAHESELAIRCTELFGDRVRVVHLYDGLPPGPYLKPPGPAKVHAPDTSITAPG
jgi:hypothetical protein